MNEELISKWKLLIRSGGTALLEDEAKLCLTTVHLASLERIFVAIGAEVRGSFEVTESNQFYPLQDDILEIYQFLSKVSNLKLFHQQSSIQGVLNISLFDSLQHLQLKKIPLHLIVGLQKLRTRLHSISCQQCVKCIKELLLTCGGDRSSGYEWSNLEKLELQHNNLRTLDEVFELAPAIKHVNFSFNKISSCFDNLQILHDLEIVHLGYNCLKCIPTLTSHSRLHTLILRYNQITSLHGIDSISSLQHLDISHNCILSFQSLTLLRSLSKLEILLLEGNPISYHKRYRETVAGALHNFVTQRVILDRIKLNVKPVQLVRMSMPVGFLQPAERQINPVNSNAIIEGTSVNQIHAGNHQSNSIEYLSHSTDTPISSARNINEGEGYVPLSASLGGAKAKKTRKKRTRKVEQVHIIDQSDEPYVLPTPSYTLSTPFKPDNDCNTQLERSLTPEKFEVPVYIGDHIQPASFSLPQPESLRSQSDILKLALEQQHKEKEEFLEKRDAVLQDKLAALNNHDDIQLEENKDLDGECFEVFNDDVPILLSIMEDCLDERADSGLLLRSFQYYKLQSVVAADQFNAVLTWNYNVEEKKKCVYRFQNVSKQEKFMELMQVIVKNNNFNNSGSSVYILKCLKCNAEKVSEDVSGATQFCEACKMALIEIVPDENYVSKYSKNKEYKKSRDQILSCKSSNEISTANFMSSQDDIYQPATNGRHRISTASSQSSIVVLPDKLDEVFQESDAEVTPCGSLSSQVLSSMVSSVYEQSLTRKASLTKNTSSSDTDESVTLSPRVPSPLNGSNFINDLSFSERDFRSTDHRFKLYLMLNVFQNDKEELELNLKTHARFIPKQAQGQPAIFVVSSEFVYLLDASDSSVNSAQPLLLEKPLSIHKIEYVTVGLGYQSLQIKFADFPSVLLLLLYDMVQAKRFLQQFTTFLEKVATTNVSQLLSISKLNIASSDNLQSVLDKDEEASSFFICWLRCGADDDPCCLVLSASRLLLVHFEFEDALPGAKAAACSFQLRDHQVYTNIQLIECPSDQDIDILFQEEEGNYHWCIHVATKVIRGQILAAIESNR